MPIRMNDSEEIFYDPDFDKEIRKPLELGYYHEAISKTDVIIDSALSSIVMVYFHDEKCSELIWRITKSIRNFRVGGVQAQMLSYEDKVKGIEPLIPLKLQKRIQDFKTKRSTVLHSELGAYELMMKENGVPVPDTKEFEEATRAKVKILIEEGIEIINELRKIAVENIPEEWYQTDDEKPRE